MNTIMHAIDTLQIYERLKKAKASDALSKEMADIIGNLVDEKLATKNDVCKTELSLQKDLKNTELRLQNDLKNTELRLKNDLKNTELKIQSEIAQSKSETIRWIISWVTGLLVAQTGFLLTYLK